MEESEYGKGNIGLVFSIGVEKGLGIVVCQSQSAFPGLCGW